jgi:hypothetical protein
VEYTIKTCVELAFAGELIPESLPWNLLTCGQMKEEALEKTFEEVRLDLEDWELPDDKGPAIE